MLLCPGNLKPKFACLTEVLIALCFFSIPFALNSFNRIWWLLLVVGGTHAVLFKNRHHSIPPTSGYLIGLISIVVISVLNGEYVSLSASKADYYFMGMLTGWVSYNFAGGDERRIRRLNGYFILSAILASLVAVYQIFFLTVPHDLRVTATFSNTFYLALWSGIGLYCLLISYPHFQNRPYSRLAISAGAVLLTLVFLLSQTRAAWLGLGILVLIGIVYYPGQTSFMPWLSVIVVFFAIIIIGNDSIRSRVCTMIANQEDPRWQVWSQTLTMIREQFRVDDWILGRGPGAFKIDFPHYDRAALSWTFPHCIGLELFYTTGVSGLGIFSIWILAYLRKLHRLMRSRAVSVFLGLASLIPIQVLITTMINESFFSRYFSFLFWLFAGVSLSVLNLRENHPLGETSPQNEI